jgi:PKD repeat protein
MTRNLVAIGTIVAATALAACTVKQTETPAVTGPSALALSVSIAATPDSILQDGASQSSVVVTAYGPDGKARSGVSVRLSMVVNNVEQDFGTLAARTIVTGSDGKATTIYTAPPAPPALAGGAGSTVSLLATPIGSDAVQSPSHGTPSVNIRLVPPGVILPPASTPTAKFTFTPTPVNFNIPVTFDASTSCAGNADANGNCQSTTSTISSYQWTFGDGGTASGKTATHTYVASTTPSTGFNVTLTVTNDRGVAASTTQQVLVSASPPPSGDWVFSPTTPLVGETIFFNADAVKPTAGHTIVQYTWNWGDGTPTGSGFQTTHVFTAAGSYTVVLSVRDDADQKSVITKVLTIGTGNPTAAFVAAVTNAGTHTVTLDGSGSVAIGTATIASYQWAFGDGTFAGPNSTPTVVKSYGGAGSFSVTLTVTDSLGRIGRVTVSVTVP